MQPRTAAGPLPGLSLSRRVGESIIIGDGALTIRLADLGRGWARLTVPEGAGLFIFWQARAGAPPKQTPPSTEYTIGKGERLLFRIGGHKVVLTLHGTAPHAAKFIVNAPRDVRVFRAELIADSTCGHPA